MTVSTPTSSLPLVSILIRSVSRLPLLQQALDSVAGQTYGNIEVLVVAAIPNHPPLPTLCGRLPLRLILAEQPLHRARAANVALECARGEFLLFLDDDDWLLPEHVEKLVTTLTTQPDLLAVYTAVQPTEHNGEPKGAVLYAPYDSIRLLAGNFLPLHAVLFRRRVIDLGCRFDESLDLFEDWDFLLQIASFSDFAFVSGVSAFYRIHASSGVHENVRFVGPAYARLYAKWRHRWSEEQLANIMARVWAHGDMEFLVAELERIVRSTQQEVQAMDQELQAKTEEIRSKDQELRAKVEEIRAQRRVLEERQIHIEAIWRSRSWRITRPLRAVSRALSIAAPLLKKAVRDPKRAWGGLGRTLHKLRSGGLRRMKHPATSTPMTPSEYAEWIIHFEPGPESFPRFREIAAAWDSPPLISVVMPTYNTDPALLEAAIGSVHEQVYPHWQLCIADDASDAPQVRNLLLQHAARDQRIQVVFRAINGHISAASNSALALAEGDFVALLDHDDVLHPLALWFLAQTILENPTSGLIYSDEDKLSIDGKRHDPYFKCEFNHELLLAQNMISHLGCYRRSLFTEIGGFREGFEGSQDYDLALRAIDHLTPEQIVHIPRVLYHWRVIPESTASSTDAKPYALDAARRALTEHLQRRRLDARVVPAPEVPFMNRVQFALPSPAPLVSIIIPTRDRADLLRICLDSIRSLSTYPNYEIIVIDNGSVEPETLSLLGDLRESGGRVLRDDSPFNYSRLNNRAAGEAAGSVLCLMNNDIEIITHGWLEEMVSFAMQDGIGAVGARLWYPDNTLQHAGVILGMGGIAGHSFRLLPRGMPGYFARAALHQSLSAVTGACLVIRKTVFDEVGGLDEGLAIAFNDVDFCLRVRQAGYRNVWTPYAEMYHHESASRGEDTAPDKQARFASEIALMRDRWGDELDSDPAYSPNLTLAANDFGLAWPPRVSFAV